MVVVVTGEEDSDEATEIPLPNVKNHVLVKVIEFCKHHKTDPMNDIEKVREREREKEEGRKEGNNSLVGFI